MPDQEKTTKATKEKIVPVDFEEVESIRSKWLNTYNLLILILILAGMLFLGFLYLRSRQRPEPPAEETPAGENIWIPGIDYQPKESEDR